MRPLVLACLASLAFLPACRSSGAHDDAPGAEDGPLQTERLEQLRYELLDPADHTFRVTYELSATTPGARTYLTPVRGDTFVSAVSALDLFTGAKLDVGLVAGKEARKRGHPAADPDGSYFLVVLDRAVPADGEVRLRLSVNYEDRASYEHLGDECAFQRLLAVRDVTVVLPPRHALLDVNQPARITRLDDGRLELAYTKAGHAPVPLRVRARALPEGVELPLAPAGDAERTDTPPLSLSEPAPRDERLTCELADPAHGELVWRHEYAVDAAGGERWEKLAGEIVKVRVLALDTGAELAHRVAGEIQVAGERQTHVAFVPGAEPARESLATNGAAATTEAAARGAEPRPEPPHAPSSQGATPPVEAAAPEASQPETPRPAPRVRVEARVRARQLRLAGDGVCVFTADPRTAELRLPAGWSVLACSTPAAVRTCADGRVELEFGAASAGARVVSAWKLPAPK